MAEKEPNYDRIVQLIRAYQTDELDEASKTELDTWRLASSGNQDLFDELNSPTKLSRAIKEMNAFDAAARFNEFEQKHLSRPDNKLRSLGYRIAAGMAAAVAIITLGIWLYTNSIRPVVSHSAQMAKQNDIEPGKQGATLTLADGRKIKLSDATNGTLYKEAGVTITKTEDGQLLYEVGMQPTTQDGPPKPLLGATNTLSTANGESYQLRLPDGTLVYLNAGSTLTYPSAFPASGRRMVKLQGEAYFSVAHDQSKPFIVKTDQQEVSVLGTEFNINAYGDDNRTTTTLVKGSVRVNATKQVILTPGQQSTLANGQLLVQKADIESATGWKNGMFLFYNSDMTSIMRQLSRWYNIEVDLSTLPDKRFYGEISRDVKLSEVLAMLEATGNIQFKLEGRRLMLQK